MLVFVAALDEEIRPVRRSLKHAQPRTVGALPAWVGTANGVEVLLVPSGMGRELALQAVRAVLAATRPEGVVSIGYAGACAPDMSRGSLVLAAGVAGPGDGQPAVSCSAHLLEVAHDVLRITRIPFHVGVLTSALALARPEEKARAWSERGAVAVDMESYWYGVEAERQAVPFLAVRAVSDGPDDVLPDFSRFEDAMGRRSIAGLIRYLGGHPRMLLPTARLGLGAAAARRSLARFAAPFLCEYARTRTPA
jgi:adenosylhomocysteine nucleosidase